MTAEAVAARQNASDAELRAVAGRMTVAGLGERMAMRPQAQPSTRSTSISSTTRSGFGRGAW